MKEHPLRISTVNRSQEDIQWEIARNKVIEKRRNDSSFFQICSNDRYKLIREDLRDYIDEEVIEKENYESKLSDNATTLSRYFTTHENVCPHCAFVNSNSSNYCVNCGELLMAHQRQCVIPLSVYNDFIHRPSISIAEYKKIKIQSELSIWEKCLDRFTKDILSSIVFGVSFVGLCCIVIALILYMIGFEIQACYIVSASIALISAIFIYNVIVAFKEKMKNKILDKEHYYDNCYLVDKYENVEP